MKTEDKIRAILHLVDKSTASFLNEVLKKSISFGSFTEKQAAAVDLIFDRVRAGTNKPKGPRERSAEELDKERCELCFDAGVVVVHIDGIKTYALCDYVTNHQKCRQGEWQIWKLPYFSTVGVAERLDWREFKPDDGVIMGTKFWEKVQWWKEKLRIAEQFWASRAIDISVSAPQSPYAADTSSDSQTSIPQT